MLWHSIANGTRRSTAFAESVLCVASAHQVLAVLDRLFDRPAGRVAAYRVLDTGRTVGGTHGDVVPAGAGALVSAEDDLHRHRAQRPVPKAVHRGYLDGGDAAV